MQYFAKKHSSSGYDIGKNLNLVYASKVTNQEFQENPRSFHCHKDILELVLCLSGTCLIIIDGNPYHAAAGDIVIYNEGSYHQECASESSDFSLYCLAAKGVSIPGFADNCVARPDAPKLLHTGDSFPLFEMLFSRIFDLLRIDNFLDASLIRYYLHVLICEMLALREAQDTAAITAPAGTSSVVQQIFEFLSEHYMEKITLQEIGKALCLSPDYISHVFKKASGYAPMQYVNALRIGSAQVKLIETDHKIADIAMDVGFNNIGNFNRAFSNFVGDTPRAFRSHHSHQQRGK